MQCLGSYTSATSSVLEDGHLHRLVDKATSLNEVSTSLSLDFAVYFNTY